MRLLIPFLVLPIIEIALFIQVGGLIGVLPTIVLVILSAVAGTWLMRRQGLAALADLQGAFRDFRDPSAPLAHGALILLAGGLMILPGFFTDALGILLLIPAVRRLVIARLGRRVRVASAGFAQGAGADRHRRGPGGSGPVIDAAYVVIEEEGDDASPPPAGGQRISGPPSGWTRH